MIGAKKLEIHASRPCQSKIKNEGGADEETKFVTKHVKVGQESVLVHYLAYPSGELTRANFPEQKTSGEEKADVKDQCNQVFKGEDEGKVHQVVAEKFKNTRGRGKNLFRKFKLPTERGKGRPPKAIVKKEVNP